MAQQKKKPSTSSKAEKDTTKKATAEEATPSNLIIDSNASHTPIIIGDGSASIDFSKIDYVKNVGTSNFSANDLRLRSIIVDSSLGAHVCHMVPPGETCVITVVCRLAGSEDKNFVIRGGTPISIEFDGTEYVETHPNDVRRANHRNENRTISSMTIRDGQDQLIHDCDLVLNGTGRMITINDPHLPH